MPSYRPSDPQPDPNPYPPKRGRRKKPPVGGYAPDPKPKRMPNGTTIKPARPKLPNDSKGILIKPARPKPPSGTKGPDGSRKPRKPQPKKPQPPSSARPAPKSSKTVDPKVKNSPAYKMYIQNKLRKKM